MKKEKIYRYVRRSHTFGKKLLSQKKLVKGKEHTVLIDNDEIAAFLIKKYPSVTFSDYNKTKRNFKEPNLKFLIFRDLLDYSLRADVNIILSNGNLGKDIRDLVITHAKKYSYKIILVYFNLPRKIIKHRINNTTKSSQSFLLSKKLVRGTKKTRGIRSTSAIKKWNYSFF